MIVFSILFVIYTKKHNLLVIGHNMEIIIGLNANY